MEVPPYLWTIKAIRVEKCAEKMKNFDKNQPFTLPAATQDGKCRADEMPSKKQENRIKRGR
jgi:hypothetical protein